MTPGDAPEREPQPAPQTMLLDGLEGIRRTVRVETAGAPGKRAQGKLVSVNHGNSEPDTPGFHFAAPALRRAFVSMA
jgi:hypothetical protein